MRSMQKQIIDDLKVKPSIDPKQEIRNRIDFLKNYMKKFSFLKSLVLGISGGQDSTLTGKIAQLAISELREETGNNDYKFIAVRLPYGKQADESDAMDAIKFMNADSVIRVDIKSMADSAVAAVEEDGPEISDFNKGNIKARERMIAQYAIAGQESGAVLGTDHAAEAISGFYTKFGDGAADITPIFGLNKRQGKELLKLLNAPEHLYEKVPTADLEDNRPALPDEVALGVRYDDIDDYLEGKDVSDKVAAIIENRYKNTAHKRHLPINIYDDFWK
ncbi:ammonia-dependent NAD(+) synthetase [Apilactobacillus micheneri]|uniref:NH(3)-dependent NAD(+) synthetase n=1 Tax=Apilactobacillus micheneri TaxID=1899430 RepID=A0ABY2YV73_9LACO|nr:ammonia-dependent NAD(+) synthetase [Apilactobacillus micheneri]TPR24186.1 ammonia-dependent NAD(+) synthetase [Apilactobacillus micheneri]TPR25205.1 ammonia-dependent NAD(+) synthetase [Apilactobacillus micheneri]TPR27517.1 ammonia-dependent NAD(+) synthetase [Apilactobacillus micheneri]TPR28782.1 ammonia-dependent NAD(+) synthetase [Apilactobacillus micheneri]TPR29804.1 ammonia-dependent NAD(+) synthetase [Apilactobacillus micheneri]